MNTQQSKDVTAGVRAVIASHIGREVRIEELTNDLERLDTFDVDGILQELQDRFNIWYPPFVYNTLETVSDLCDMTRHLIQQQANK